MDEAAARFVSSVGVTVSVAVEVPVVGWVVKDGSSGPAPHAASAKEPAITVAVVAKRFLSFISDSLAGALVCADGARLAGALVCADGVRLAEPSQPQERALSLQWRYRKNHE